MLQIRDFCVQDRRGKSWLQNISRTPLNGTKQRSPNIYMDLQFHIPIQTNLKMIILSKRSKTQNGYNLIPFKESSKSVATKKGYCKNTVCCLGDHSYVVLGRGRRQMQPGRGKQVSSKVLFHSLDYRSTLFILFLKCYIYAIIHLSA